MNAPIYLDYQATTPIDPRVRAAMLPFLDEAFGNPHSEHTYGWTAAEAVDRAADAVAALIGALPDEIVFTSGATEANNMALQGIARSLARRGNHIVVSAIEHKCVLNTALWLKGQGFEVDVIPVGRNGIVDANRVQSVLRADTALVSVMLANNEIGSLQPVAEIGALCRERGIVMHSDAAQAVGKIAVDVDQLNVDLMSLSAHKLYGPKGIGALYISRHCPTPLEPLIIGGAQQDGRRAGTLPPFLCAGMGEACRIANDELDSDQRHALALRAALLERLESRFPGLVLNGDREAHLPGCLNVQLPGVDADSLLTSLQGSLAASTGSACNSGLIESSYVLMAIGLSVGAANSSIRLGVGRFTTSSDIETAIELIAAKAARLENSFVYS